MVLAIRKSKSHIIKLLVLFQLYYVCFVQLLIDHGFPRSLTLVCDFINCLLFFCLIAYYGKTIRIIRSLKPYYVLFSLFFFMGTLSALLYGFNIVLWLWSFRNFGRFLLFFTSCLVFLEFKDYELLRRSFYVIGHICFLLCLYQFFVLKLRGDFIGGIFGTNQGVANTWVNVFVIIVFTISITDWFYLKKGGMKFLIVVIESMVIAVVGELKFLFLEIIFITILCILFSSKTYKRFYKTMFIFLLGIIVLGITIPVLYSLFPMFKNFFTFDVLVKTATESYTGTGDLGRLTAVYGISKNIFENDLFKILFGIGLGNGEYSGQQQFLQSEFYLKYQYTNYNWFSDAIVMVQNGLTGIMLFVSGFVYLAIKVYKNIKKNRLNNYCLSSFILLIICLFLFVYNISLNCEIAYLIFAVIAMGFVDVEKGISLKIPGSEK